MHKDRICSRCGRTISIERERTVTDEEYGAGKYDWLCNLRGDLCFSCATFELHILNNTPDILKIERIKTCCHCGNSLLASKVKNRIDSHFGTGKYDWICKICGPLCFGCAACELNSESEENNEVHEKSYVEIESRELDL